LASSFLFKKVVMAAVTWAAIGLGDFKTGSFLGSLPQNSSNLACLAHLALFQMVSAIPRSEKLL